MITINNLSKTFGDNEALIDVNLNFDDGMVYGIVGPNGAGKTTLFKCIAGILTYTGEITYSLENIKNYMGFLATEPYFLSFITGREYLQLLCNARKIKTPNFDETNIFDLPLDRYATQYSTGMKKKLALMGILLQKNQVFILDEPFNGVDVQSNLLITEIILTLKAMHKTMLISSHILSTLTEVCDYFIVLKEGRINSNSNLEAFREIEKQMRKTEIGNKIERLRLE
jgi:ABC-2 type transport system ATP-binding protein